MIKRIFAWLALVGFAFIIFNMFVLKFQTDITLIIYAIIMFMYLISLSNKNNNKIADNFLKYEFKYGKDKISFNVPRVLVKAQLLPNDFEDKIDEKAVIKNALENPIGAPKIDSAFKKGDKICIITSDITRPMPSYKVLPQLIKRLNDAGVHDHDITIVFALGSHRSHTKEEKIVLVGENIFSKIKCIDSDMTKCVNVGTTSYGTPIDVFDVVAHADKRICLGNIEYHYFAGYSGGAKAIMPGVSSRQAIQSNHSKMVLETARAGKIKDNPVRQDIEEITNHISVDYLLNVVLDNNKKIIGAFAGNVKAAHREGCKFLDSVYLCPIEEKADIVIASPGGFPKDINLYQAQKALYNAGQAVKEGGVIVLIASCKEGLGESVFEKWIMNSTTPDKMISDIESKFELGGHKAAAIAMIKKKADIYLISDLDDKIAGKIFMTPFKKIEEAISSAINKKGKNASIIIMPTAGSTLPIVDEKLR